jgi:hypothetical protein
LLFTVISDVDAGLRLLLNHMPHTAIHRLCELLFVDHLSLFPPDEKIREFGVAWKTAYMRH